MASILTKQQETALGVIADSNLAGQFYFSGGTALAHYYLQHRKSEDLDFFNEQEFDPSEISITLKSLQNRLGYFSLDYQSTFNRNLFFLHFKSGYILKLEFTYYPFKQIELPVNKSGMNVDSLIDIATNKLFTIVQTPRGRDYYDLYCIVKKANYSIERLRLLAKQKFDWPIDLLQLASRFEEIDMHLDDPIMVDQIDLASLSDFFHQEAFKLAPAILEA